VETILSLKTSERGPYFEKAAEVLGMAPQIIEKDFWVCWTLRELFTLPVIKDHLTFKGGTSLSKIFKVIQRFSEDIDISIERSYLGFVGNKDPESATGSKQRNAILGELAVACQKFVKNDLLVALNREISSKLANNSWKLEIDPDDPDLQTILLTYPQSLSSASEYVRPIVKIEIGARSEHWPVSLRDINSYLKEALPTVVNEDTVSLKVLNIERTFWEKATILHMYAHYPDEKHPPIRQSRHYYDFYCLLKSSYKAEATKDAELLERVAAHKSIYFRAAWASYETAKKGSLKLVPNARVLTEMENDYELMSEMFFKGPPAWGEILKEISLFETEFNA
jgi:hypothetical protein